MNKEERSTEGKALTPLSGVVYIVILESGRKFFYIVYNLKKKKKKLKLWNIRILRNELLKALNCSRAPCRLSFNKYNLFKRLLNLCEIV